MLSRSGFHPDPPVEQRPLSSGKEVRWTLYWLALPIQGRYDTKWRLLPWKTMGRVAATWRVHVAGIQGDSEAAWLQASDYEANVDGLGCTCSTHRGRASGT